MRVDCAHPGYLHLPLVRNYIVLFVHFTLACSVVCLLTACFFPKASTPAVTNAEESGWQGMHVSLSKANEPHFLISPLLMGSGCKFIKSTILGELISAH